MLQQTQHHRKLRLAASLLCTHACYYPGVKSPDLFLTQLRVLICLCFHQPPTCVHWRTLLALQDGGEAGLFLSSLHPNRRAHLVRLGGHCLVDSHSYYDTHNPACVLPALRVSCIDYWACSQDKAPCTTHPPVLPVGLVTEHCMGDHTGTSSA